MYDFNYHKPRTIEEAIGLFATAEDAVYLAGGHTLIPAMKVRLRAPTDVIDLSEIDGLSGIREETGALVIGALATHDSVATSDIVARAVPALNDLAAGIGDAQIRNRGTIGGSVANNDPAADYPAALLALGATITTDRREIRAEDFFSAMFDTALGEGELIQSVSFPIVESAAYVKFPNPASRYATVGVFISRHGGQASVAITGAAPGVFLCREMGQALSGNFTQTALDSVRLDVDEMNSDMHASAEYRAHLCVVMAKRAVALMS
jgi:aerobic carbon-monoxide dehydrogenase medium subunit